MNYLPVHIQGQVIIARAEAIRNREKTSRSYVKLAKSSTELEQRIKHNEFHITLERAINVVPIKKETNR